ncbi:MAG: regulatory iron-sulfur-containing complex subunit RicT, partial [bacterium]
ALVMKMTDAEWQWDRKKLTFYFTAEKRVDFRTLVRELASMFRTRIELKQIGVRDEAKRLDGIGRCGRQYCSASWLPELRPVNLGVAKDQRLSLNPSQISGACGRLMCCLRYEHEFYVQSRRKYPKELKTVRTSKGEEKVLANDIFRERVTLRGMDGEVRFVSLAELRDEMSAAGDPLAAALNAASQDLRSTSISVEPADVDDTMEDGVSLAYEAVESGPRRETQQLRAVREPRAPRISNPVRIPVPVPAPFPEPARARTSAPVDASDVVPTPDADQVVAESVADGERRAQRRRGRRGGRRNRPSGGSNTNDGNDSGGSAPTGA